MTDEWTPEAARERLEKARAQQTAYRAIPADRFGSGAMWAQRESARLGLKQAYERYCLDTAPTDLAHALDVLAAETERADRLEAQMERVGDLWHDRWEAAAQKAARYEAVLRFYADPDVWSEHDHRVDPQGIPYREWRVRPVLADEGERARAALKGESV